MESLKVEKLLKSFGGLNVLGGLSFSVEAGEYVAVIGPNGAGKTTLLNVITGELSVDSGRLYLFGRDITTMPTYERIQAGLGRSFQITRLFYDLTLRDNIALALHASRPSRYSIFRKATRYKDVTDEAEALLRVIGLWQKKDQLVASVSYGEQRKVEISLALASKPKVLLMDEPTVGLAPGESRDFIDMVKSLAADTAVLFTAHDINVVFTLAKRVIVLYFGEIVAEGSPEQIQRDEKVREIYLGTKKDVRIRA